MTSGAGGVNACGQIDDPDAMNKKKEGHCKTHSLQSKCRAVTLYGSYSKFCRWRQTEETRRNKQPLQKLLI